MNTTNETPMPDDFVPRPYNGIGVLYNAEESKNKPRISQHKKRAHIFNGVIEPEKTYSLYALVRGGVFATNQFSTARNWVIEDSMSENPILKAVITGNGLHKSYSILGQHVLDYLAVNKDRMITYSEPIDNEKEIE